MDCHLQLITAAAKSAAPLLITGRKECGGLSLDGNRQEVGQQHISVPRKAEHILSVLAGVEPADGGKGFIPSKTT